MDINLRFRIFQFILGSYLCCHFMDQIIHNKFNETFGANMPYTKKMTPFPNFLDYDWEIEEYNLIHYIFTVLALIFSFDAILPIFCHYGKSSNAFFLWFYWISLLNRNILIANPGIPYVGFLLMSYIFVPFLSIEGKKTLYKIILFFVGFGYMVSGLHKLQCPSWIDGSALYNVLSGPLARDNIIRDTLFQYPDLLKLATWGSLSFEILSLILIASPYTRSFTTIMYIVFHLGILSVINFADLTMGMLLVHILTLEFTNDIRKKYE